MKPVSPELMTLLSSRQFYSADLWTIILTSGLVLRYTSGDQDISANGYFYSAGSVTGPFFDRTGNKAKCHWGVGTNVDTLVLDIIPGSALVDGTPFLQAAREGIFDAAEVMLERAFMPTYGDTSRGVIRYFVGRVAETVMGRSLLTISINSHLELLNQQFPRNLAQTGCMNQLGDGQCQVNLSNPAYFVTGQVVLTSTTGQVNANLSATPPTTGAFNFGQLTWTSGEMSGESYSVAGSILLGSQAQLNMVGYMTAAPAILDTFTLTFGCNKSFTDQDGCPKFANQVHFRGFPFTPQPSTAV